MEKIVITDLWKYFSDVDILIEQLRRISWSVSTTRMVTPINFNQEKSEWLSYAGDGSFFYVPNFKYDQRYLKNVTKYRQEIDEVREKIKRLKPTNLASETLKTLAKQIAFELSCSIGMAEGMLEGNDRKTAKYAAKKYGSVNDATERAAVEALGSMGKKKRSDKIKKLEELQFSPTRIVETLNEVMEEYNRYTLEKFDEKFGEVELSNDVTAITLCENRRRSSVPVLKVPSNHRLVNGLELLMLPLHEIECHARDSFNGKKLLHGLCGGELHSTQGILREGHAMIEENKLYKELGGACKKPEPFYAWVIARAQRKEQVDNISKDLYSSVLKTQADPMRALEKTWNILYRTLFRGRTNFHSGSDYIFTKDKCYFEGFTFASNLSKNPHLAKWLEIGALSYENYECLRGAVELPDHEFLPVPNLNVVRKGLNLV